MNPVITQLKNLKDGDKFYFCKEDGTPASSTNYYVEGQYPRFGCTTIFPEYAIKPIRFNPLRGLKQIEHVTAVNNDQYVMPLEEFLDITHVVNEDNYRVN